MQLSHSPVTSSSQDQTLPTPALQHIISFFFLYGDKPNSGQNWKIKIANESFKNVAKFRLVDDTDKSE
jgi:hypothetical protein